MRPTRFARRFGRAPFKLSFAELTWALIDLEPHQTSPAERVGDRLCHSA